MSIASTQRFQDAHVAHAIANTLAVGQLRVTDRRDEIVEEAAPLPYTTADLLEDATQRWGWTGEHVMSIAQQLFEAGWITYPRTDSHRLSADAQEALRQAVIERYGAEALAPGKRGTISPTAAGDVRLEQEADRQTREQPQWPGWMRIVESVLPGRSARKHGDATPGVVIIPVDDLLDTRNEDAHEAIRPTDPFRTPETLDARAEQVQLYTLIWQRSLASQMKPARYRRITVALEMIG